MSKDDQQWDLSKAIGYKLGEIEFEVTDRDIILYALGIGFQKDPKKKEHYNFTYENADDFATFPTMSAAFGSKFPLPTDVPGMPKYNPMMLLHGEQSCEFLQPIESGTKIILKKTLLDLKDKKQATVAVLGVEGINKETGEIIFRNTENLFIRGIGGFGHEGKVNINIPKIPKRSPDAEVEHHTDANQAFIYRLSGDLNPLHVDPKMSSLGGFKVPILHGLCFYGITAKTVFEKYHPDDISLLNKVNVRFTGHVFPGETLVIQMWKQGSSVIVQTKTKERNTVVLKGVCELKPEAKL